MSVLLKSTESLSPSFQVPAEKIAPDAYGYSRDFLGQRFVYLTISPRARGLSIGINLNPDGQCNFDCIYCEVDRSGPRPDAVVNCAIAREELENTLEFVHTGLIRNQPPYSGLPPELTALRHVALSGDGEPTMCPNFLEIVEMAVHVRACGRHPFFKIVLITNASHLDAFQVQAGLSLLTKRDEIWAKLDAGTQSFMDRINRSAVPLEKILANILDTARRRPVVIQSLFSSVDGEMPPQSEIIEFAHRLRELKDAGAKISLVQIYSATRPVQSNRVEHLPLRVMRQIAGTVQDLAGLRVEVS